LSERTVILADIPGAQFHDGGRMAFGPDGLLYITTGDAGNGANAQDRNSLAGKILRLKDDGSIPSDNPFGTLGHRNPQGLAWDDAGRLWATEHGRSGARSGFDEINLIEAGKNYGWPDSEGDETADGVIAPVRHSGASATWAPAGAAFFDGSIFFTGLRGEALYEARLHEREIESFTAHFAGEFGRLRAAVLGPDGFLYITTSNTDGRGRPRSDDDKIIKVDPAIFR
jgi:glucose/arabinose dehydrogenase